MGLEQVMVRRGQAIAVMRSDQDPHAELVQKAHDAAGQRPAAGEIDEDVGRLAQHHLREEIVGAAHGVHGPRAVEGGV